MTLSGNPEITNISDGQHFLIVFANDTLGNMGASQPVYFSIDNTAPNITLLMPLEETYSAADVPLTLFIDEPIAQLSYSLDDQPPISITGNITLPALPDGNHKIVVQAVDELGNSGISDEVSFVISTFPTFWVATAITSSIIILASGYLFIKRDKPNDKSLKMPKA
jgi:hypothetical protein